MIETHFCLQRHRDGLEQKSAHFTLFVYCTRYDTMYATVGCVLREAFDDDTIPGVEREQTCTLQTIKGSGHFNGNLRERRMPEFSCEISQAD